MTARNPVYERPLFEPPWRRLPWFIPGALATCMILAAFAKVLDQRPVPPLHREAIEVHIIPQPAPVGGLQGGPEKKIASAKPLHHITKPKLRPSQPPPALAKITPVLPGAVTSSTGIATGGAIGRTEASTAPEGAGSGGGIGTDRIGARAIYHPIPAIPDDLREDVFQAEAVAHFTVSSDGTVTVTLSKPTTNPRLNQILLATLSQWTFFPAVKDGVAINSAFDVRIPITVQ
jgi:periplasmic protein TonB